MSGGVDSSVAASILLEEGYDTVGFVMRLMDPDGSERGIPRCCAPADIMDARRVAADLGIPAYVLDLRDVFKERIYAYFYDSYLQGKTPNPCILCNSELKFGVLMQKAAEIGAEKIATGHYARISYSEDTGRFLLKRAVDRSKDQAYFLFNLKQDQLARILFPVGTMMKDEVRKKAETFSLRIAEKRESQDACFAVGGDYRAIYAAKERGGKGNIVDSSGKVLGKHGGVHNFTVGQRRGMGIAHRKPLYVLRIDPMRNLVIVGEEHELLIDEMEIVDVNWIQWETPPEELRAHIRIRSTHTGEAGTARRVSEDRWKISFDRPVKGVTAGQAAVLYDEEHVLGGGWIVDAQED